MTRAWIVLLFAAYAHAAHAAGPTRARATSVPYAGSPCGKSDSRDSGREERGFKLRLCVTAEFDSIDFNTPAYLASLGGPVTLLSGNAGAAVEVEARGMRRWLVTFSLESALPRADVELELVGRRWAVALRGITWRASGSAQVADLMVDISIPDPSWPVLHGARMLPGDGPNASILEVVVENRSKAPIAINNVMLVASTDAGFRCSSGQPQEPVQTVHITWPRAIANADRAAWTSVRGADVAAETSFKPANCGDYDHRFSIKFPVQDTLPAAQLTRLVYRIEETHIENNLGTKLPRTLREWGSVSIGVSASTTVLPSNVRLAR